MPNQRVGPKALAEDIERALRKVEASEALSPVAPYTTSEQRLIDQLDSVQWGKAQAPMPRDDKFAAIALMCGPPTDTFRWDKQKTENFVQLAEKLFGIKQHRDVRGLYALYEKWYAGEDLDRMLAERQASKEAGNS